MRVTVWRLKDPAGIETRCVVAQGESDACELRVEQEDQVIHTERRHSVDAALLRADTMRLMCQRDGWKEC